MRTSLIDFRFEYNNQNNPFKTKTELNLDKLQKFMNAIYSNEAIFRTLNWVDQSRYFNAISKQQVVFGQPLFSDISKCPNMCIKLVDALDELEDKLKTKYHPDLKKFIETKMEQKTLLIQQAASGASGASTASTASTASIPSSNPSGNLNSMVQSTPGVVSIADTITSTTQPKQIVSFADINIMNKNPKYSYDLSTGKTLTYNECIELVLNKSRSNLSNKVMKDENVLFIEEREKSNLKLEIKTYTTHNEKLRTLFPTDNIDNMSLKELQTIYTEIKNQYEFEKVENVLNKSCELFDLGYNALCPNGIKIPGKNKAIKLKGLGEALQCCLNDRSSTTAIACKNLQKKYNLKVPDEADLIFSLCQSMIKNITIVDYEPTKKDSKDDSPEEFNDAKDDLSDDSDDSDDSME